MREPVTAHVAVRDILHIAIDTVPLMEEGPGILAIDAIARPWLGARGPGKVVQVLARIARATDDFRRGRLSAHQALTAVIVELDPWPFHDDGEEDPEAPRSRTPEFA